jgi:hypothetical protein
MYNSNDNQNGANLPSVEREEIMRKFLVQLGELPYSDYEPEESYRFYERSRGKDFRGE